jgi:hypothetical protein
MALTATAHRMPVEASYSGARCVLLRDGSKPNDRDPSRLISERRAPRACTRGPSGRRRGCGGVVLGCLARASGQSPLRASLITAWLEVRVLPGPPRNPMRTDVSRSLTNSPQFAGISAGSNAGRAVSVAGRGRDSVDFGFRSLGSPNPFLAPA